MKPAVPIYGGFNGTETSLGQRNWVSNVTTLSGDIGTPGVSDDNCYHVVRGSNEGILDGFTICAGNGNGSGPDHQRRAGGLYCDGTSPTVRNCTFTTNYALYGGAIETLMGALPVIEDCLFTNNTAVHGGAIANDVTRPTIRRCVFIGNSATSQAGAIHNQFSASPTISNCIFSANTASDQGGALVNVGGAQDIRNCTFRGNSSAQGGALHNRNGALPNIKASIKTMV
jgi:hypothetical protein